MTEYEMILEGKYPPFQIRCDRCDKAPHVPCSTWDGYPVPCVDRVRMAEMLVGKWA